MSEILFCSICYQYPAKYLRQCKCSYCEKCRSASKTNCSCGGGGQLAPINEGFHLFLSTPLNSAKEIFEHSFIETEVKLMELFKAEINSLFNYYRLQEVLLNKKIIRIQEKIFKTETEIETLRIAASQKGNGISDKREWGLTPTNQIKLGFDLSPFEAFMKNSYK